MAPKKQPEAAPATPPASLLVNNITPVEGLKVWIHVIDDKGRTEPRCEECSRDNLLPITSSRSTSAPCYRCDRAPAATKKGKGGELAIRQIWATPGVAVPTVSDAPIVEAEAST